MTKLMDLMDPTAFGHLIRLSDGSRRQRFPGDEGDHQGHRQTCVACVACVARVLCPASLQVVTISGCFLFVLCSRFRRCFLEKNFSTT